VSTIGVEAVWTAAPGTKLVDWPLDDVDGVKLKFEPGPASAPANDEARAAGRAAAAVDDAGLVRPASAVVVRVAAGEAD